jgi:hypothetical protein
MHAEGRQNPAFEKLSDRNSIATLKCKLQQDVARVSIDALLAGLFAGARRPGVQQVDEFRQGVRGVWPRRMIRRQQETGCVGHELANGYPTDIIAVQFGDVFVDGVVQLQFAAEHSERDQRSLKQLSHRSDIQQRVRRDGPLLGLISEPEIEELYLTGDVSGGCDAAWMAGHRHRSNVLRHDLSYVRVHLRIRKNGSRPAEQKQEREA